MENCVDLKKYVENDRILYLKAHGNTIFPDTIIDREEFFQQNKEMIVNLDSKSILFLSRLAEPTYFGTIENYVKLNYQDLEDIICLRDKKISFQKEVEKIKDDISLPMSIHSGSMNNMELDFFFDTAGGSNKELPVFLYRSGINNYKGKDNFLMENCVSFTYDKWTSFKNEWILTENQLKMVFDDIIWKYCFATELPMTQDQIDSDDEDPVLSFLNLNNKDSVLEEIREKFRQEDPDDLEALWEELENGSKFPEGPPDYNRILGDWFYKQNLEKIRNDGYVQVSKLLSTTFADILNIENLFHPETLIILLACRTNYSKNPVIKELQEQEHTRTDPKRILDSVLGEDLCNYQNCGPGPSDILPKVSCRQRGCYECNQEAGKCESCRDYEVITVICSTSLSICLTLDEILSQVPYYFKDFNEVPYIPTNVLNNCYIPKQTLTAILSIPWENVIPPILPSTAQTLTITAFKNALEDSDSLVKLQRLKEKFIQYINNVVNAFKFMQQNDLLYCWDNTMKPVLEVYIREKINSISQYTYGKESWMKRTRKDAELFEEDSYSDYLTHVCPSWRLRDYCNFECEEHTIGYIVFCSKKLDDILNKFYNTKNDYRDDLENFLGNVVDYFPPI